MNTQISTTRKTFQRSLMSLAVGTAAAGALGAAALGFAGTAAASGDGVGNSSAADTVNSLQANGYNVQLNGTPDVPLSECSVTGIHGLTGGSAGLATAYVDISCPSYT